MLIPQDFDYRALQGLSNESKSRLIKVCPETLGQASRISGIRPTDITLIGLQIKNMITLLLSGQFSDAAILHRKLLPIFKGLFWVTNPIPIKYALNQSGFHVGPTRLPLCEPDIDFSKKFDSLISNYEIDVTGG